MVLQIFGHKQKNVTNKLNFIPMHPLPSKAFHQKPKMSTSFGTRRNATTVIQPHPPEIMNVLTKHLIVIVMFQSGPKQWTNWPTDQHCLSQSRAKSMAKNQFQSQYVIIYNNICTQWQKILKQLDFTLFKKQKQVT